MAKAFRIGLRVPDYRLVVGNELEADLAAAAQIQSNVIQRLQAGEGATGALPPTKDGRPGIRSGELAASIGILQRERRTKSGSKISVVVRPLGKRTGNTDQRSEKKETFAADVEVRRRAAAQKQKALRAAVAASVLVRALANGSASVAHMLTKAGRLKVSKLRVRTADTNAALAGILSQPPKDKRAKAGGRGQYRIMQANQQDREDAAREVARTLAVSLVADGYTEKK